MTKKLNTMKKSIDNPCFMLPGGKGHRLVIDPDTKRFPLGRAKCAPFPRLPQDEVMEPNDVPQSKFCRLCL
jgi:hypothetical protein